MNVSVFLVFVLVTIYHVRSVTEVEKWLQKQAQVKGRVIKEVVHDEVGHRVIPVTENTVLRFEDREFKIVGYPWTWPGNPDKNIGPIQMEVDIYVWLVEEHDEHNKDKITKKYKFIITNNWAKVAEWEETYVAKHKKFEEDKAKKQAKLDDYKELSDMNKLRTRLFEGFYTAKWDVDVEDNGRVFHIEWVAPGQYMAIKTTPNAKISAEMLCDFMIDLGIYEFKASAITLEDDASFHLKDVDGMEAQINAMTYRIINNVQGKVVGKDPPKFLASMYMKHGFVFRDKGDIDKCNELQEAFSKLSLAEMRANADKYKGTLKLIDSAGLLFLAKDKIKDMLLKDVLMLLYKNKYYYRWQDIIKTLGREDENFEKLKKVEFDKYNNHMILNVADAQKNGLYPENKAKNAMQDFENEYDEYYDDSEFKRLYKQYLIRSNGWKQGYVHRKQKRFAN